MLPVQIVGRMASRIAPLLVGKHRPNYSASLRRFGCSVWSSCASSPVAARAVPHVDSGDYVVVLNAEKVRFTGNKEKQKIYYHHSGSVVCAAFRCCSSRCGLPGTLAG